MLAALFHSDLFLKIKNQTFFNHGNGIWDKDHLNSFNIPGFRISNFKIILNEFHLEWISSKCQWISLLLGAELWISEFKSFFNSGDGKFTEMSIDLAHFGRFINMKIQKQITTVKEFERNVTVFLSFWLFQNI